MLIVDAATICLYDRMTTLEESTIETYKNRLVLFCRSLPDCISLDDFSVHHVQVHLSYIAETSKWGTLSTSYMALRIFCNWLEENRLIPVNWFSDPGYKLKLPKKPRKPRRHIDIAGLKKLIQTAFLEGDLETYKGKTALRDAACMSFMLGTGARRAEVLGIKMDAVSIDTEREEIKVRLLGKGGQARFVYAIGAAYDALMTWLTIRPSEGEYLFTTLGLKFKKNKPMSLYSINVRMRYWCEQAGTKPFTPHDFRRAFITNAINKGINMAQLQLIVGHAHISTTAIYYLPDEEDLRDAIGLINNDFL